MSTPATPQDNMDNPLRISVVIPVYNGAAHIVHALESVVQQTLPAYEIIVVDDGSTDDTAAAVREFAQMRASSNEAGHIELVQQANQGHADAKNTGLAHAQGDLIAFLDADDRWLPQKLAAQARYLAEQPALGYVLCHMRAMLTPGTEWPKHLNRQHYENDPPLYAPSAIMARRTLFDTIGNFDTSFVHGNDSDWFLRAREAGIAMKVVPQVLVEKWIHGENMSHQTASMSRELFRGLRASLQRRREQQPEDSNRQARAPEQAPSLAPTGKPDPAAVCAIIPVYNAERYIGAALESILAQTVLPQAIIVVDDGSTDGTRAAVERLAQTALQLGGPPIRYLHQPNQGSAVALNRGVEVVDTEFPQAEFLAFLDADDLWEPGKTAAQLARFEQDPALEAVFGHVRQFYSPDVYSDLHANPQEQPEAGLHEGGREGGGDGGGDAAHGQNAAQPRSTVQYGQEIVAGYSANALLIRRAAFRRIGPLDPKLKACFVDWFARARHLNLRYHLLAEVVALRRVHDANLTVRARDDVQSDYFRILKENLARKRASDKRESKS